MSKEFKEDEPEATYGEFLAYLKDCREKGIKPEIRMQFLVDDEGKVEKETKTLFKDSVLTIPFKQEEKGPTVNFDEYDEKGYSTR